VLQGRDDIILDFADELDMTPLGAVCDSAMMKSELSHLRRGLTNATKQIDMATKQGEDWSPYLKSPLATCESRTQALEAEAAKMEETYAAMCKFYAYMGDESGEMGFEKFFVMMTTFLNMVREAQKKLTEDMAKEAKRARVARAKDRAKAGKAKKTRRGR
jgi:hypothetical protein